MNKLKNQLLEMNQNTKNSVSEQEFSEHVKKNDY